ncbi:MAG: recombinase family protein, partial [Citrobacter freundii]|nr:recombinase family protein [Citrobacter freundii]
TMNRPELIRLLGDAEPGDVILIEQVDRLTRLDDAGWETLRKQITDKQLAIVSLDLPTSHLALSSTVSDAFTRSMLKAVNGMMLDMLAAIARKDYEDRRRRQSEGIIKAKAEGKYRGRVADVQKHELIRTLRLANGKSLRETARLAGVSKMTVIRVCSSTDK